MHRRYALFAVALPLLLAACAGGPPPEPPAPPPLDPTGAWDLLIDAGGQSFGAVMTISGSAVDGYTGYIDSDLGGASISDVLVDGQSLTFSIPDINGLVTFTYDGAELSGSMDGMMGAGTLTGVRQPGG